MSSSTDTSLVPLAAMVAAPVVVGGVVIGAVALGVAALAKAMLAEYDAARREYEDGVAANRREFEARKAAGANAAAAVAALIERTRPNPVERLAESFMAPMQLAAQASSAPQSTGHPASARIAELRNRLSTLLDASKSVSQLAEFRAATAQFASLDALRNRDPAYALQGYEQLLRNAQAASKKYLEAKKEIRCLAADAAAKLQSIARQPGLAAFHAEADALLGKLAAAAEADGSEGLIALRKLAEAVSALFTRVEVKLRDDLVSAHIDEVLTRMGYQPQRIGNRLSIAVQDRVGIEIGIDGDRVRTEMVAFSHEAARSIQTNEENAVCDVVDRLADELERAAGTPLQHRARTIRDPRVVERPAAETARSRHHEAPNRKTHAAD